MMKLPQSTKSCLYALGLLCAITPSIAASSTAYKQAKSLELGGFAEYNYLWTDWSKARKDQVGTMNLYNFRLNVDAEENGLIYSAQYAWFESFNTAMHAYIAYKPDECRTFKFGLFQEPFGLLPYATHSWWFGVPYYMGMEYNFRNGFGYEYAHDDWTVHAALFKNDVWGSLDGTSSNRYYYQLFNDGTNYTESESNQVNVRVAKKFHVCKDLTHEFGVSARIGRTLNSDSGAASDRDGTENGWSYAWSAHLETNWRKWNLQLEYLAYIYDVKAGKNRAAPIDREMGRVQVGAFGASHTIPAAANVFVANVSRTLDWSNRFVKGVTVYNDFSVVPRSRYALSATWLDIVGASFDMAPVHVYVEGLIARNMTGFLVSNIGDNAATTGSTDSGNLTRRNSFGVNVNVSYSF